MWPPEALEFLRELEDNNDRAWFKANRARYDTHLVEPARALAASVADLGEARLFRPYKDARFSEGPPIKEQLGIAIGYAGAGGYYVELSLDGLLVGGGLHHPAPDQLDRFRRAIDDDRVAPGFDRALRDAQDAGMQIIDPVMKRGPRGYRLDHPRIEHLKRKHLTLFCRHALEPWLHEPACVERVRAQLVATTPLVAWLAAHVGPSQLPPPRRRGDR
jgi:uncharacterized protein (TIGR02453 family)